MLWHKIMLCDVNHQLFLVKHLDLARFERIKFLFSNAGCSSMDNNSNQNIKLTHLRCNHLDDTRAHLVITRVENKYFLLIGLDRISHLTIRRLWLLKKHTQRFSLAVEAAFEIIHGLIETLVTDCVSSISEKLENGFSDFEKNCWLVKCVHMNIY